jgi:hypothetical protein
LINLENSKWNIEARRKLGLKLKGPLEEYDAQMVRLEAGKLKTAAAIRLLSPTAVVKGLTVGSKKLTLQVNI